MIDRSQPNFITTELDLTLLSTPFEVQTNWQVITGGPCSGKTTLIEQLADKGYRTVPETARLHFEREMAKGRTIDEIRENGVALERCLIDIQMRYEDGLRATDIVFLDRALPDSLTFSRYVGLNPNEILVDCFHYRYASVFMLDRLPYQLDTVRAEDDAIAGLLEEWLIRDYNALGYNVVRVPVLPIEDRLAFILERVSEQRLV